MIYPPPLLLPISNDEYTGWLVVFFQVWKYIKIRIFGIAWGILVRNFFPLPNQNPFFLKCILSEFSSRTWRKKNKCNTSMRYQKNIGWCAMCSDFFFIYSTKDHQKKIRTPKKHLHENNLFFKHLELSTRKKFPKKFFSNLLNSCNPLYFPTIHMKEKETELKCWM